MKVYLGPYKKNGSDRKLDVRIDKYDLWGLDHSLALIIYPALVMMKEVKQGGPHVDDADVPEELRVPDDFKDDGGMSTDNNWFKRWDWVLDEMIFAFKCTADGDWEDQFHSGEHDIIWKPVDKEGNEVPEEGAAWFELVNGPKDTHKFDREGYEAAAKRIRNGHRLFGVYYSALWD